MHIEPAPRDLDEREPIAWLRAYTEGVEPRVLPLFRRPARVAVGSGRACDWRFENAELAELELTLVWDGVRLRAEDATQPDSRATVRHGQSIIAGASGRLRIALDLVLHDDEVTMIRKIELPPQPDERTLPVPLLPPSYDDRDDEADQRTVITVVPPPRPPEPPWRLYLPPRNGAADDEPTGEWPLDDALRPTADLLARLGKRGLYELARRTPPRRIALWGALALVVAIEVAMLLRPRRPAPQPIVQAPAASAHSANGSNARSSVMLPDKDVEVTVHRAIAAYRAGKVADALAEFYAPRRRDPRSGGARHALRPAQPRREHAMRIGLIIAAAVTAALAALLLGCAPDDSERFDVHVEALSDEGLPLEGLPVKIDDRLVGRTDGDGVVDLSLPGPEGRRVTIAVDPPSGFRGATETRSIVLERLVRADGARAHIEVATRFAPLSRNYVLLVDVGEAALPIEIFGVQKGMTNSEGVAMMLVPGVPGDDLQVRVTRGGRRDLVPSLLSHTFSLPDHASVCVLDGRFTTLRHPPPPRPHRPLRL